MCWPPAPEARKVSMRRSLGSMVSSTFLGLRHHGHRDGGGMDAALGLSLRHPLHPVNAAFKFQLAEGSHAFHAQDQFLDAAQLGLAQADDLGAPALPGGVHRVHPPQAGRKQRGLLSAGTGADLQNHALVIVDVPG